MKKAVTLVCAGMLVIQVCGLAFAGDDKNPAKWQEKRVEKMAKKLDLTKEQKEKVAAIFKESGDKIQAETQKMQEAKKAIREDESQKIKAVLTPDQAQKYEKMQAERKEKMEKKEKKMDKRDKHYEDKK
jgi:Spy/CpxP family protein refolding chaperone